MPAPSNPKIKAQAFKLYAEGLTKVEIAKRCNTSCRTIQRWLADAEPVTLAAKVTDAPKPETMTKRDIEPESCHTPSPLSQIAKIATAQPGQVTLVEFSRTTALELLRLTGKSLDVVAETLDDPDARRSDRLKAAQILLSAVGIGQSHGSIFNTIKTQLEPPKPDSLRFREIQRFWGKELIPDLPAPTPKELEWRRRLQEQRAKENNDPFSVSSDHNITDSRKDTLE